MDKVISKALELKEELESLPEMKEYLKLKKLYEEDLQLKQMREEIARLDFENKLDEKKNLKEIYDNNPLVCNFNSAKEEVGNILKEIQEILSD